VFFVNRFRIEIDTFDGFDSSFWKNTILDSII